MTGIHSISRYDFDDIYTLLKPLKKSIGINDLNFEVILITDKQFLIKNILDVQDSLFQKTYFLFGTPEYLKDFTLHYIDESEDLNKSILKDRINKKCIQDFNYKKINIIKSYLKKSKCSVIKDILTVLYKIQNKSLRELYRNAIFNYLNGDVINADNLEKSLILLSKKKSSTLKELIDIVKSEIFINTHDAVINTKKGLTMKSKISAFDINYILSFKK